jgi:Spy/CpxP family protein refolding chaperone
MNPSETQVPAPPVQPPRRGGWRRVLAAIALLATGGVIGAIVTSPTFGHDWYRGGPYAWHRGYDDGPGWRDRRGWRDDDGPGWRGRDSDRRGWRDDGPGWRGRDSDRRSWRDDGPMRRGGGFGRMERAVDHVLWSVDASREQRDKITTILDGAVDDLFALRDRHLDGRRQIRDALAASTIDRGRIEALRGEQMQLADAASRRITDALTSAAEVLSPEQRSQLARRIDRWHRWFRG